MTTSIQRSPRIPLREYLLFQQEEVSSPLNQWGTGEEFHHQPTPEECWFHYINCGRAEGFCAAHTDDAIWLCSQAMQFDIMTLPQKKRERVLITYFDLWQEAIQNWETRHQKPFPTKDFIP